MELDPMQQGVMVDWTRVCGAAAKGFDVGLAGLSKVLVGDRRKREQLDLVNLNLHGSAPVDAADLDLRPRPQAVRDRDGSVCHPIAKVKAELHRAILSPAPRGATGGMRRPVEFGRGRGQDRGMARLTQLVVDSRRPASLARFWAAALDGFDVRAYDPREIARLASTRRTPDTDPCVILDGPTLEICFQEVEVRVMEKRPLHFDISSADRVNERSHLVSLSASIVQEFEHHTWMRDPDGNDFCLTDA